MMRRHTKEESEAYKKFIYKHFSPIVKCPRCEIDVASKRLKEEWVRMINLITGLLGKV